MRRLVRFVLQTLILLVVALVSALTAMRLAIHGREVAVPDLVGKTPMQARQVAELAGFQFEVERQYYSLKVPEGRVLSQLPVAGTKVRRGWEIRVAQSLGPQRVVIPNVLGESERAAEINILRRGLDLGGVATIEMPEATPNQVIAQSPSASASSISAPKISLLIAQPAPPQAFALPNFVGQSLSQASSALKNAGFQVVVANVAPQPASAPTSSQAQVPPSGTPTILVVSQDPPLGAKVLAGTVVTLQVR